MNVVHLSLHVAMQNRTSHIVCHSYSHNVIPIPTAIHTSSPKAIPIPMHTSNANYPDGSRAAASNYCRNPDGKSGGPWCHTTDPNKDWDYCPVPLCNGTCTMCSSKSDSDTPVRFFNNCVNFRRIK